MKKTIITSITCIFLNMSFAQDNAWITWYEQSGYVATPDYEKTIDFCKKIANESLMIQYTTFGKSPQGRDLPLLIIDKNGNFTPEKVRASENAVLFIEAGIHSGEIEGKDAMFILLRDMVIHDKHLDLLDHVTILFIPIFNVDGHERSSPYNRINQNGPEEMGWRTNAKNHNLNRDFLKADAPEMIAWHHLFQAWLPDFFMDVHTTDGADYQYPITYVMEIYGNMDKGLTAWVENKYIPQMTEKMENAGFPSREYVAFRRWFDPRSGLRMGVAPPRLSQGYVALQNRPGLLVETHMLKPYKNRVESTLEIVKVTLEIMNKEYSELIKLNRKADEYVISKGFREKQFPLLFERSDEDSTMIDFLGVEYEIVKSDLTGGNWFIYDSDKPKTFRIPLFNHVKVAKEISLPYAYIILPEWTDVIERLKLHGVKMETLKDTMTLKVEKYTFTNPTWQERSFEGRHPMRNIEYESSVEEETFLAGSVIIPLNQRTARVIVNILEPSGEDSYVYWGFFDPVFERKEYFEPYVMEKIAREMIRKDSSLLEGFNQFKEENPQLENNQWGQLWYFYSRSPYMDEKMNVYPVGRIMDPSLVK